MVSLFSLETVSDKKRISEERNMSFKQFSRGDSHQVVSF